LSGISARPSRAGAFASSRATFVARATTLEQHGSSPPTSPAQPPPTTSSSPATWSRPSKRRIPAQARTAPTILSSRFTQKLFSAGRALEAELRLTPLRTRTQARDDLPQQAADYEAQQGVESFARWAGKTLAPALLATELRSWDDVHRTCGRFGVVLRAHGNGLVFEDAERGVRVKASSIGRDFSKPRLSTRFGDFQPASARHLEASGRAPRRYSPMPRTVPRKLWMEYTQSLDRVRLQRTEAWDGYREIRPRLANEPKRHTTTT
jgi:hypothetical protein